MFLSFTTHVQRHTRRGRWSLWAQAVVDSLRYNVSLLEYFQFHFYEIPDTKKSMYAGTGFMYEYQLKMNPKAARHVLSNKHEFLNEYASFVGHKHLSISELRQDPHRAEELLSNTSGKVVLKNSQGQCGIGIEVIDSTGLDGAKLMTCLNKGANDLVEEFIVQHDALMRLSPSGLNTVRVITQLDSADEVNILGARLRITVDSAVDNLAAGNLAAPINIATGVVEGPAVYSDITKADQRNHPVTGVSIVGFVLPFWEEVVALTKKAALHNKSNRSIGWDVAITNSGPFLVEGNHDWCKLLWQLPVKRGLRAMLEKYL